MKRFTNQSNGSQAGRMYNGGAIIRRFALFPLMLLMLLLLPARMVAQTAASSSKYIATYESSTQTLTFKENVGETLPSNSVVVKDKMTVATINKNLGIGNGTIVHIVFDKSFSTYTPTSLYCFFQNLTKLETITGLEYLSTEKVTRMSCMFFNCSSLTSLDVTHFNTANVTDMSCMFFNCSSLTSLDVTHFNTANVTDMMSMFSNCSSLTSLDVTNFNTAKVPDMSYMFANCLALTSLYLTNFNTEKVTNMERMFSDCRALTTIYASIHCAAVRCSLGCEWLVSYEILVVVKNEIIRSKSFSRCSYLLIAILAYQLGEVASLVVGKDVVSLV
jgi:surface protein